MSSKLRTFLSLTLSLVGALPVLAQESLLQRLEGLPDAKIEKIRAPKGFEQAFRIRLSQPLDHTAPDGASFEQRIFLSHRGFDRPVVLDTEGYAVRGNRVLELGRILEANQIIVEHRFFGESKPDRLEWRHLTVRQAAEDHHRVVGLFRKLYDGKWLSTGISKGGQTALIHRRYFPDDVDATFVYVAPINRALEDERIDRFFGEVGDEETRGKIDAFQILVLEKREEMLRLLREHSKKKKLEYERIGEAVAFEYGVLEYPFSFWQWGKAKASSIPGADASAKEIFDHFVRVVDFYYYSDRGLDFISTFFYQSSTELGYYGYLVGHLKHLLKAVERPCNTLFAPVGVKTTFDPEVMKDVQGWLQTKGERIIHLHGALDPWSAPAIEPREGLDAMCIKKPGANHTVRIRNLSEEEQGRVFSALERWMGVKVKLLIRQKERSVRRLPRRGERGSTVSAGGAVRDRG